MKAPSFFIAAEDNNGMTMEYRSKRRGFQYYVQGQVKELSKNFAQEIKKLEIELKKQEVSLYEQAQFKLELGLLQPKFTKMRWYEMFGTLVQATFVMVTFVQIILYSIFFSQHFVDTTFHLSQKFLGHKISLATKKFLDSKWI